MGELQDTSQENELFIMVRMSNMTRDAIFVLLLQALYKDDAQLSTPTTTEVYLCNQTALCEQ